MPKEKVEISNLRKTTKTSNSTTQNPKLPAKSKNEEIKKSRESSTDRTNQSIRSKNEEIKKSMEPSTNRIIRNNLNKNTTVENKTNNKKIDSISSRNIVTKSITNLNKAKSSASNLNKSKISNNAASTSSTTKPIKALKPTSIVTKTSTSSRSNMPSKGTKSSSRDVTSKRVTKEQFFPKKFPFSSYLHESKDKTKPTEDTIRKIENKTKTKIHTLPESNIKPPKLTRERTMTRILSTSELNVIKNIVENKSITKELSDDRPRTATIRKSEPNQNAANSVTETDAVSEKSSNEYEDDFESYESDFEAYSSSSSSNSFDSSDSLSIETDGHVDTSSSSESERIIEFTQKRTNSAGTDDERKMDSGNYDLHDIKHKQILDNIKEAIEKENSNLNKSINKKETINSLASLSDEGFEDGSKYLLINNGFVNFMDAKKKQHKKKINSKSKKRGFELMNMIRLNSVYFSLFDMEAVTYEDFMQSYGKSGTIQISSQTGDDDLHEEIQTDHIEMIDKQTQYPIRFSKEDDSSVNETLNHNSQINNIESRKLNKFMEKAGNLILHILQQKETKIQLQIKQNYSDIPFSDGYLSIDFEKTQFLRNRTVSYMTYSKNGQLLTVHQSGIEVFMNENEQLLARPSICLWDIYKLSHPEYILVSSGEITRACFDSLHGNIIFGGISDGSISVWDLRETSSVHRTVYDEYTDENQLMRIATFTTIPVINLEPSNEKIIAVKSFHTDVSTPKQNEITTSQNGIQICTLTESGNIIIWSLIQKQATPELLSENQGLVIWASIILIQGLVIKLDNLNPNLKELECFDLQIHQSDANHLFITSNYGILHCLASGMKPKTKLFFTETVTNCLEMAPFSSNYFISGCGNGNIKLHSKFYAKPLMTLRTLEDNNKTESKIEMIQWSNCRPCVFFVKDDRNNIHIWDLMSSDMFPIYTIPFNENISDIKLSPILRLNEPIYMTIANKEYGIRLHKMRKEFCSLTAEQYKTELNTFLNYANRL